MSLGNLDITGRENPGPLDLLRDVQQIIDAHIPGWRDDGWGPDGGGSYVCMACDARLSPAEYATHTAQQLWENGYLDVKVLSEAPTNVLEKVYARGAMAALDSVRGRDDRSDAALDHIAQIIGAEE